MAATAADRRRRTPKGAPTPRPEASERTDRIAAAPPADGLARTLLEVGRRNFTEHGFHTASVAQIAEEAGTSVGLLYYHFRNKEGLYRAIWTDYQKRQWQHAHEAIKLVRSAGITDGRLLFLVGTRAYMSNAWDNRDIVALFHIKDMPPGFAAESRAVTEEWVRMNTQLLKFPENRDTQVLVEMASAAIGAAVRLISQCAVREDADEVVEIAMSIFARLMEANDTEPPVPDPASPTSTKKRATAAVKPEPARRRAD
jgi:AcrR family transcriptional regulator